MSLKINYKASQKKVNTKIMHKQHQNQNRNKTNKKKKQFDRHKINKRLIVFPSDAAGCGRSYTFHVAYMYALNGNTITSNKL